MLIGSEFRFPPAVRGLATLLLAATLLTPALAQTQKVNPDPDARSEEEQRERSEQTNIIERYKWFMKGRHVPGKSAAELRIRAFRQKQALRALNQQRWSKLATQTTQAPGSTTTTGATSAPAGGGPATSTPPFTTPWTHLGPVPISRENSAFGDMNGRVTAIAVDQTDGSGNTVLVGGAYGGVWKSTNAADATSDNVQWTPLTDSEASLAANAIAISPANHNIILVGTGEPDFAGDSYYGLGIMRSTDGGATWTLITQDVSGHPFKGMGVSKFAWSTTNPNLVIAGLSNGTAITYGSNPGGNQGVYYSTDAGATWNKATNGLSVFGSTTDVVYNSTAGMFFAGLRNQGVFSSLDGATWTRLTTQPVTLAASCQNTATCAAYRISLASHPSKNEIYALVLATATTVNGIARSTNGGGAWTTLTTSGIAACGDSGGCGFGQGFYDLVLAAVPNGANTDLYAGMVNLFRCSNAATTTCTWTNLTHVYGSNPLQSHPDYHSFDYLQSSPAKLFYGNDGGLYRSTNGIVGTGTGAVQNLNAHLGSFSQFVGMGQHPTDPAVFTGGLQDNGSLDRDSLHFSTITPNMTWWPVLGGDGGYAAIDQTTPRLWYNEQVYITIQRCDTSANPGFDANGTGGGCIPNAYTRVVCSAQGSGYNGCVQNIPDEGQFYTKFILDPANQAKLLLGTCKVWRGNADGTGWTAVSTANALSNQLPGGNSSASNCSGSEPSVGALAAGGPSTANGSQVIYAGFSDGELWVTTNATLGLATWSNRSGPWGANQIGDVEIDTSDASGLTAYVGIQAFGINHVYKTVDGGANWTGIGGGLPDVPVDAIAISPLDVTHNTIYVGTDMGVYYTTDGGATWAEYGPATGAGAFPNSPVTEMFIFNVGATKKLRASTYGRGVWEIDIASNNNDYSLTSSNAIVSVRPGQTAHFDATAARQGSFSASVALTCNPDPPTTGTACGITPTSADLAGNASVPVTVDVTTNAGTTTVGDHVFNLHGDGGTITHDLALTLRVNDFSVGSTTTQQTIGQTGTATYNATVTPQGNFSDPVALSCANFSSAGLSCSFSQNNFTPGTNPVNVTVTLTAASNATLGAGTFDVVGTSGSTTPSVSLSYNVVLVQDFTFVGGTTTQTVLAGNPGNFSGTLTPLNSFSASNMTLSCTGLPASGACNFTPASPSIGSATPQPLAIQVTDPSSTTAAGYNITATALDSVSGKTHSIPLTLNVGNFTLAASPSTRTVAPAAGSTYTVTVTAQNGYAGLVTLGCNALPANVTCSFFPAAVTPGNTSTLTVLTATGVTAGAKTISVTGTAEGQTRTAANVTLTVSTTQPSFNLTITPSTKTVNVGASTTYTINVKATTTTSPGSVTMSCAQPLPTGVTCPTFTPATLTPTTTGTNVTATVLTSNSTPAANQTIAFQAATTSQLKRINGTLQVQDYTLGVSPTSRIIAAPGGQTTYAITLTALNGFGTSANLSCTGLPAGWTCGFAPASVPPTGAGAGSTLTLTTTATPFGPTDFTVQAVAGSLTHTQLISVTNGSNDYQLSLASGTALVAVRPGQTANWSVQLSRFGTFSALVNESCSPNPPATGTACNITPNPADLTSGPGLAAALSVATNAGTTAIGDYSFNFHADGGGSQHDLPLTLRVNDFSIVSTTPSQTIQQTATGAYTVTVTGLNNWTASVALSCANFTTTGLSCTFSQNNFVPAGGGTSVTVTVTAAGNAQITPGGSFDIIASDGTTQHTVSRDYSVILVQDFTYSNATGQQAVLPGQTANYSTTLTPLNAFGANVSLSCSGLPTGASCSFSPLSPVVIGSATPQPVTVSIVTGSTTPAADSTVTVTATGGGKTHSVSLSLRVQSFTLSVSPTSRTIPAGAGTTFNVTVNAQNGLTLPVTLSCATPPAGVTCIPPSDVTPGSSGTMVVQVAAGTIAGAKTVTIRGTTAFGVPVVNQNVTVTISTTAASFTLTNSTATKIVSQGGSTTFSLSVKATSTVSPGAVTMSCVPPLPTGVACSFNPASFTPTTTARAVTATVTTTNSTPAQSFGLQFQAASTSQFRRVNGTLQVADYTLGVSPSTRTIPSASGGTATYTATLTAIDGFNTSTSLSCTGLPAGWSCGFAPTSVTPTGAGAASTLTLTTTNTPLGPQNFTISATGGGITHTQQVEVINGQDFILSAGTPITVNRNSSNTTTVNATAIGTFASSVALSCSSVPAGLSCGFVPTSINAGTPSTLTISADNTVTGGQYTVTVQGQSSSPLLTHTINVTVNVPDYSVGLTGGSNAVMRGANLQLNGTATSLGGFASSVTFTCSTGDANVPCVASSPVIPAGGGAPVTVTVSPNGAATATSYNVTLSGDDGAGHVHSSVPFGINVQDFAVAATDAALSVEAGDASGAYSGSVTGFNFTGNVALTCSSPSISVTCAFLPSATIAASGGGTAYSFTITPSGTAGTYPVIITGTAGGVTRTATVHITIVPSQDWSYSYDAGTPQSQTVNAGQSAGYLINLTPNSGFASQVALTCSVTGAPAGVGCGIVGSPLTPPGAITLNVTTTSGTVAPGAYSIVVSGTGGGKTRATTASLTVRDFSLNVAPATRNVAPGATADYTVSTATASAFPNNATLSCAVLTSPTGTGCSFDSGTLAPGGSTTMHVSSTSGTPAGSYTVQVTATSGVTVHTFNVTFVVASPNDFTITTSTPTRTTDRPGFTTYTVTVTATGTFAESVTLSCVGQPAGVVCGSSAAFVPSTIGTAKSMSVSVGSTAVPGTYNFQIKGTSATKNHSVTVQLIIN